MSDMAFWNDGSPRFVRSKRVDKVTGRTIGTAANAELDLYPVKVIGPKAGNYEIQATDTYALLDNEITVTRSLTGFKHIDIIKTSKLSDSEKTKGAMLSDSDWEVIAELDPSRNPGKPRTMPQDTKNKRLAIITAHDDFEIAVTAETDLTILVDMQPAFPVEE